MLFQQESDRVIKSRNNIPTDNPVDLSLFSQTNQQSEQDLYNALSPIQVAAFGRTTSHPTINSHENKIRQRLKYKDNEDEEENEPSYISFYKYPAKKSDQEKKRQKELKFMDSSSDQTNFITFNKSASSTIRRGSFYNNGLRRSMTPQKTEINKSNQEEQQDENVFQRMQISRISKFFVLKIRQLSHMYNYRHLKRVHFEIIDDLSSATKYESVEIITEPIFYHKKINRLLQLFIESLNKVVSSNPDSLFFLLWNIVYLFALLSYLFYIPMVYSFEVQQAHFESGVMIIFGVKILLSLVEGIYSGGEIILDKARIVRDYFRVSIYIDIVVILTIQFQFCMFLCFLRAPSVFRSIKSALYHSQLVRKYQFIYEIISLVILLFLQVQISACLFHFVGRSQFVNHPENNWLFQLGINNSYWSDRYMYSLYYAFTTLMNVIYGDVHAYNNPERLTVVIICMCSYFSFGYFLSVVSLLLQEIILSLQEFYQKRQIIMNYMIQRNISASNQIKMMHFLEYLLQNHQNNDNGSQQLLEDIPSNLRNSIFQDFFGTILEQNRNISNHFSKKFIHELAQSMSEMVIQPGQKIVEQGKASTKVYFLIKGQVEIYLPNQHSDSILQKLTNRGTDISLKSSFTNKLLPYSARGGEKEQTTLAFFEIDDFIEIIKRYPPDFESFCSWRDELLFSEHQLNLKCKSCKNIDHELNECPLINLRLSKQRVIGQLQSELFQERIVYERKNYEKNIGRQKQKQLTDQHHEREEQYSLNQSKSETNLKVRCMKYGTLSDMKQVNTSLREYRIFLTKAVVPQMAENITNIFTISDDQFYKLMPPIKIVNCDENMFEFSPERAQQYQEDEQSSSRKRVSLERIVENSQSSSSSSTTTETSSENEQTEPQQRRNTFNVISEEERIKKQYQNQNNDNTNQIQNENNFITKHNLSPFNNHSKTNNNLLTNINSKSHYITLQSAINKNNNIPNSNSNYNILQDQSSINYPIRNGQINSINNNNNNVQTDQNSKSYRNINIKSNTRSRSQSQNKHLPSSNYDRIRKQKLKQQQQFINMNTVLEQKKKINNDPSKPNVPINGYKLRNDKLKNTLTKKMLLFEQLKQKRLKALQFLWNQKQQSQSPIHSNNRDKYAKRGSLLSCTNKQDEMQIEINVLKQRNFNQNIFLFDFDKFQSFKRYKPYYNYQNVIQRYNTTSEKLKQFNFIPLTIKKKNSQQAFSTQNKNI